ncbi:MAG: hypothetical protein HRT35_35405 [Algicola sp.]|nr:hypothetical protein [Algicola sp.]
MNFKFSLNKYINLSEKWLTKIVLVWCLASLLIGLFTLDDLALVIAVPLMTVFMYFAGMAMLMAIIGFQRVNPFNSTKSKFIDYAIIFFWVGGIFGFMNFLTIGIFQSSDIENSRYFFIVASVFPLGSSLGAAKQWKKSSANE